MKTAARHLTKPRSTRGDTIVEVLISVTIISFVLGAAYLLTSHSLQAGLAAREHSEALNYVQGQIERLKIAKETDPNFNATYRLSTPPNPAFCLFVDPSGATKTVSKVAAADPRCAVDSATPVGGRYHLSTTYSKPTDVNPKTFKFSATWERVGTGTTERVDIYYRVAE